MKNLLSFAFILLSFAFNLSAQEKLSEKELAKQAEIHFKNRDYLKAIGLLEKIGIEYRNSSPELNYYLILSHFETRNIHLANELSATIPVKTPKKMPLFEAELLNLKTLQEKYDSLMMITQKQLEAENFKAALMSINGALEIDSFRVNGYYCRGLVHLKDSSYQLAINDFEKVLRIAEPDAATYYQLGLCQIALGNSDAAIERFTQCLQLNPSASAYYYRASVYAYKEDLKNAQKDVNEAIRINPDLPGAYHLRGWISKYNGDCKSAVEDFELAEQDIINNKALITSKAECYVDLGQARKAAAAYDRLIQTEPGNAWAYFKRGNCITDIQFYNNFAGHVEALKYYDKALELEPRNAEFLYWRAISTKMTDNDKKAMEYLDKAIAISPATYKYYDERNTLHELTATVFRIRRNALYEGIRNINALEKDTALKYLNISKLYKTIFSFTTIKAYQDTALLFINKSIETGSRLAEAYYQRASMHDDRGNTAQAELDYRKAIELDPQYYLAYSALGWMLKHMNEIDKALQVFRDAQVYYPDSEQMARYVKEMEQLKMKKK
jgi:tetratricopeptide (TPR) repeat protein